MPITINDVRFSYCNLFQPQARPGQEPKYSVTILIPKTNAAAKAAVDQAVQEAIAAGVSKCWNGQRPPMPALCIHDGDGTRPSDGMPYGEECKGHWIITASSKQPPFVVDAQVQKIINPTEVYSGMWGNVMRPDWVKIRAQDRNGQWFEMEGTDMTARCFCHEISHLDGHMYTELTERLYTAEELDEILAQEGEQANHPKRERRGRRRR